MPREHASASGARARERAGCCCCQPRFPLQAAPFPNMLQYLTYALASATTLAAASPVGSAPRCNPESAALEVNEAPDQNVPLTLLPQDKGEESPACLDGSPYGFYFVPSKTGSTKWTISINGGGWCYDEVDCFCRSKGGLGSSKADAKTGGCSCINPNEDGTMDTDCNCIHMPYSDGASFAGYRAKPQPVPAGPGVPAGSTVTFRGIKNLDGVIDFAKGHGLDKATEFVVTGGSAGGLSTFLHADRFAAALPTGCKARAAPVVCVAHYRHATPALLLLLLLLLLLPWRLEALECERGPPVAVLAPLPHTRDRLAVFCPGAYGPSISGGLLPRSRVSGLATVAPRRVLFVRTDPVCAACGCLQ
jgi:hypothetical protein